MCGQVWEAACFASPPIISHDSSVKADQWPMEQQWRGETSLKCDALKSVCMCLRRWLVYIHSKSLARNTEATAAGSNDTETANTLRTTRFTHVPVSPWWWSSSVCCACDGDRYLYDLLVVGVILNVSPLSSLSLYLSVRQSLSLTSATPPRVSAGSACCPA